MKASAFLDIRNALLAVAAVMAVTLAGAWIIELSGYPPCTLCLYQRKPYYLLAFAIPAYLAATRNPGPRLDLFVAGATICILLVSAGLGIFHAGVEGGFWQGPAGCSGSLDASSVENLLETLRNTRPVSCTKASFWVFGMSLSVWNFIISLGLSGLVAAAVAREYRLRR